MKIERKTVGSINILAFTGEFDAMDLADANEKMGGVTDEGATRLIFNLSDLTFINSMWISYLLKTAKDLRAQGGDLVLSEPSRFFQRVGQAIGLEKVLETFPDDQAALEDFGAGGAAV